MKKRLLIVCLTALVLLSGCWKKGKTDETQIPESTPLETTAAETTRQTVPGVAENLFDENGELTVEETEPPAPVQTIPAQTIPPATIPQRPQQSGSGGIVEPEPPEEPDITPPTTVPNPTESPETQPTQPEETQPTQPAPTEPQEMDYAAYQAMSPAQQQEFMESFESIEAFFVWYENAKQEHDKANPPIDVGSGSIDLDDIINGNNG